MFVPVTNESLLIGGYSTYIKSSANYVTYASSIEGEMLLTDNELFILWFCDLLKKTIDTAD